MLARDDNGIKVGAEWFSVFPFGTHTVNPDDGKEKRLQGLPEGLSKRVELAFEAEAAADNAGVCVCACVCVHACMLGNANPSDANYRSVGSDGMFK